MLIGCFYGKLRSLSVLLYTLLCSPLIGEKDKINKVKVKFTLTGHEGPEGEKYGSTLSLTVKLDGVGSQHHDPAALPLGKTT
jgi:hypothetical protein